MNDEFSEGISYSSFAKVAQDSSTIQHKNLIHHLIDKDEKSVSEDFTSRGKKEDHVVLESAESKRDQRGNFISQVRAIFKKNIALQGKQRGTNICQILTPIVCLAFIWLIKSLIGNQLSVYIIEFDVPFIFNVPYEKVYGNQSPLTQNLNISLNITSCLEYYLYDFDANVSQSTIDFVGSYTEGMLSRYFPPIEILRNEYICPYYGFANPFFERPMNGTINNQIYQSLKTLNNANFSAYFDDYILPDGAVHFYNANETNLDIRLQINDVRVSEYHRNNGVTKYHFNLPIDVDEGDLLAMNIHDGLLILQDMISKSYIKTLYDDVFLLSGSQVMLNTMSGAAIIGAIVSLAGASVYPIAVSLLLPVFMYAIVLEKEERLREIMKMNGLKMPIYWFVNYLWSVGLYLVAMLVFLGFGRYILVTDFFVDTNFSVLFFCLFGWGLCQVSLSFFYQNFFSKAKTSMIGGYLLTLWTVFIGVTYATTAYPLPRDIPLAIILFPPFAMTRILYVLSAKCSGLVGCVNGFSEFNQEMWICFIVLYAGAAVILIVGLYLDAVLPQEYGVRKHPLFFLNWIFGVGRENKKGKNPKKSFTSFAEDNRHKSSKVINENEEEDVTKEREYVEGLETPNEHPLFIKNLRKVYKAVGGKPPKVAVQNFCLHVGKGEVFGLLGPNGAGKTSLISMLTGLYPPEGGNAWVGGYDILNEIENVHTQMGVCPQFDLLWPDLTVEEHLYFYVRIRGAPVSQEKALVSKALKEVYLTSFADFKTKQLSGGMKRRLSVAIALVGDPKIIFLDEPTTGLDPENRRQLWNILTEARGSRAMVLTTHSMEEADVLCTRIGIITDGRLRCIGTQTRLKAKFGSGYHLYINCDRRAIDQSVSMRNSAIQREGMLEESFLRVKKFMNSFLPQAGLKSEFNGNLIYLVPTEGIEVSKVFEVLESKKEELAISDWGVSQATLEDVFMEIVERTSAHEDLEEEDLLHN